MRMMRTILSVAVLMALATSPAGAQQTILGSSFKLKQKPGIPSSRVLDVKAKETATLNTLTGDAATNGASVTLITNGATSGSQTFTLPAGAAWKRYPRDPMLPLYAWKYKDSKGLNSSLAGLELKAKSGTFMLKVKAKAKYGSGISVGPPNPGTYAGIVATINGAGGDTYCVNFGGAAAGSFTMNTDKALMIKKPSAESVCPSLTPTCGDGVVQPPFETCDVGDDTACPGLCGSNGFACECPFCGDSVQDPAEACDGAALGSCTEGCSFTCACTTCGNNTQENPAEGCDGTDDFDCPGMCLPPGNPNQCQCPVCGDNSVNNAGEVCDGTDDSACPGQCIGAFEPNECTCAVCGNNVTELPAEDCDGTDDGNCPGMCSITCTCP